MAIGLPGIFCSFFWFFFNNTHFQDVFSMCRLFLIPGHSPNKPPHFRSLQWIKSSYWDFPPKTPQLGTNRFQLTAPVQPRCPGKSKLLSVDCTLDCGRGPEARTWKIRQGALGVTTASCCLSWEFNDKSVGSWVGVRVGGWRWRRLLWLLFFLFVLLLLLVLLDLLVFLLLPC